MTNIVCIVAHAQKENLNKVFQAAGLGNENFSRKLREIGKVSDDPTHWITNVAQPNDEFAAMLQAMANKILPEFVIEDIIDQNDAINALSTLEIYVKDNIEPLEHVAEVLTDRNLQYFDNNDV